MSRVDDLVYVLVCALEDVDRDLAEEHDDLDVARSLDWLRESARPLAEAFRAGLFQR
jgi:hypothetical protein